MSNLLSVSRTRFKAVAQGKVPLILEFKVNPQTAPYLVSSSTGMLWIEEAHPGEIVKAAVRNTDQPGALFWEVVSNVRARGLKHEWGNVQPYSEEGLRAAIAHVEEYEMGDIIVLAPMKKGKAGPEWAKPTKIGLPVRPCSWMKDKTLVVVPADLAYVGVLVHLTSTKVAIAVHNPSRSIAIVGGE
jgi:hypothetical protein